MKKPTTRVARRSRSVGAVEQKFSTPFIWSLMGHLVLCLLFFVGLPRCGSESNMLPSAINVQMVSLPSLASAPAPVPEIKAPEPEAAPVPAPKSTPVVVAKSKPKDAVSLAPKKKIEKKRSMKNKTYKPERVVQSAIKSVEKRVASSKPDPIKRALEQIQQNLKEQEKYASTTDSGATNTTSSSRQGKPTSDAQRAYYAEIYVIVYRNWAFTPQLAGGETGLSNTMVIEIMGNGKIKDNWFDRRSGNSYFDESTRRAILKSSPLPPIPEGIQKASMQLGINFSPEGLK